MTDGLWFCGRLERGDSELTLTERTTNVVHGTMQGLEEYLVFTMETGEEFVDNCLPTLDTSLRVDDNINLFRLPDCTQWNLMYESR